MLVLRHRTREREKRYGWLFPVLAPFCAAVMVGATLAMPVVDHWRAVGELRAHGGLLLYHTPTHYRFVPDTLLVEVERVSLSGRAVHDDLLVAVAKLRGLQELHLTGTSVTPEGIAALKRDRPGVTVITNR